MKRFRLFVAFLLLVVMACPVSYALHPTPHSSGVSSYRTADSLMDFLDSFFGKSEKEAPPDEPVYWPSDVPDPTGTDWRFDPADIAADGARRLTTVSVSPSGNIVAAVDRSAIDRSSQHAAGVANPFGRLPDAIYLFAKKDGRYVPDKRIAVDPQEQLELSSLLGGGCEFSWSGDESRVVVTGKWTAAGTSVSYATVSHTNLYLLDVVTGEARRLTGNSAAGEHCVLARWTDQDTVRFVRIGMEDGWQNSLCEIDVVTGEETVLAGLYSAGGAATAPLYWQVSDGTVYYVLYGMKGQTGFYATPLGGGEGSARCLVDPAQDLVETNLHPYCSSCGFTRAEISADGNWACLTVYDQRVDRLDFPFADHATMPQSDPGHAVSVVTHRPWVPCHNVFLYDLRRERLVDPFTDPSLAPTSAVVTAACFAPDGQSLLCAVFGDDGEWTIDDLTRTSFWQVDLPGGERAPVRVLETELDSSLSFPEGIQWLKDNSLCVPTAMPPLEAVQMVKPSAFAGYPVR